MSRYYKRRLNYFINKFIKQPAEGFIIVIKELLALGVMTFSTISLTLLIYILL